MSTLTRPRCVDLMPGERALIETVHGPVVAEVGTIPVVDAPTRLPVHLRFRTPLREHVIWLGAGPSVYWRGEPLAPFTHPFPVLRDPLRPAGAALQIVPYDVLGDADPGAISEILPLLAAVHECAAEALLDPLELHADRLQRAVRELQREREEERRPRVRDLVPASRERVLRAELTFLHLTSTGPDEHELRTMSRALLESWTGTPSELLASCRQLLA